MQLGIQHLPESPEQWRNRVQELIKELRRPDLTPSQDFLYRQDTAGTLSACIEGIVNEMAIRNGLPAEWLAMEIEDGEGTPITIWEVKPPSRDGVEPIETSNAALPEALLYHGFDMADGKLSIDILDCDPVFIRTVINTRHGMSFGASSGAVLNDQLIRQGANPLLIAADILEHLLDRPNRGIWDDRINHWATTRQQTPV